jgi:hypothetical protein
MSSSTGVITYRENFLLPSDKNDDGDGTTQPAFADRTNFIRNATFNYSDDYSVGHTYNGNCDPNMAEPFLVGQIGVNMKAPYWRHYSPLFTNPAGNDFYTHIGGFFINKNVPHDKIEARPITSAHSTLNHIVRAWKSFGSGSLFGDGTQGTFGLSNDNADRGSGTTGRFANPSSALRIVSNTSLSSITGTTDINNAGIWIRDEHFQITQVPNNAVTAKVGMKCRVRRDDKLRPLNWCGFYVWSEDHVAKSRIVDYCRIRNTSGNTTVPTGSLTGDPAEYNWNGSAHTNTAGALCGNYSLNSLGRTCAAFTPTAVTATEKLTIDQDDIEHWTDLEFTITLQSGINRSLGFAYFFAENATYKHALDGVNSGGFDVFEPYVTFHT